MHLSASFDAPNGGLRAGEFKKSSIALNGDNITTLSSGERFWVANCPNEAKRPSMVRQCNIKHFGKLPSLGPTVCQDFEQLVVR